MTEEVTEARIEDAMEIYYSAADGKPPSRIGIKEVLTFAMRSVSNSPTTNGEVTPRAASDDEVERVMACWMEIRRTLNHQQSEGIITYGELKAGVNNAAYIRDAAIGKDAVERWESRAALSTPTKASLAEPCSPTPITGDQT